MKSAIPFMQALLLFTPDFMKNDCSEYIKLGI